MDVFDALADPVRRAILARLADGPRRVVDLAAEHPVSRPAISRHLRILGHVGLVEAATHGRERHYRLDASPLSEIKALLDELDPPTHLIPETALDALGTEVRRTTRERRTPAAPRAEGIA